MDDAFLSSGDYELIVANERFAATIHMAPLYDPQGERVKA
jgi:4-methylaminobutanoate oxidase (formaldehyde-forming)